MGTGRPLLNRDLRKPVKLTRKRYSRIWQKGFEWIAGNPDVGLVIARLGKHFNKRAPRGIGRFSRSSEPWPADYAPAQLPDGPLALQ